MSQSTSSSRIRADSAPDSMNLERKQSQHRDAITDARPTESKHASMLAFALCDSQVQRMEMSKPGHQRPIADAGVPFELLFGPLWLHWNGEVEFGNVGGLQQVMAARRIGFGDDVNGTKSEGRIGAQDDGVVAVGAGYGQPGLARIEEQTVGHEEENGDRCEEANT